MTRNPAIRVRDLPQVTTFHPVISMKKTLLFACILAGSAHAQNRQPPTGPFMTFADGFNPNPGGAGAKPVRRPAGLAQAPNGSLFITDDTGGTIWRVSYRATLR